MSNNSFLYIDRGYKNIMALLPGWACDYRIFNQVKFAYNYLIPEFFYPQTITNDLIKELNTRAIDKITLLGFSMGGFAGLRFTLAYPHIIDKLILISVRCCYNSNEIELIKNNLKENKNGSLIQFYKSFFHNQSKMLWFKQNLMRDYCNRFSLDYLLNTLDYLAECSIESSDLQTLKDCIIFHGSNDIIAPVSEIQDLCKVANREVAILENTGHAVFLEQELIL